MVTLRRILIEKGTISSQIRDIKFLPLWHEQRVLSCRASLVGLVLIKISMAMLIMEEINIMGTTPLVDFYPFFSFCSHTHFLGFFLCAVVLVSCNCVSPSFIFLTYHLILIFFLSLPFLPCFFGLEDLCCHILWKCLNALQHRLPYILGLQDRGQFNVSASSRYKVTRV